MNENEVTVNRNYKDTVFRKLFEDKKELLSLYNALYNTHYPDPDDLEVATLENAIYLKHKNDLACILDLRLSIIEHQSSINPNMPLRMLKYIVDLYNEINSDKDIYSSKLIKLPYPSFIVLYNGVENQPERREMRLSDAYMDSPVKEVNLELKVIQLNINEGFNEKLKKDCPALMGYSFFVTEIRKNLESGMDLNKAVDTTVDTCIKEKILADFFRKNRKEVESMSLFEFNEERHNRTLYEEGREDGREEGREEGRDDERKSIITRMLERGTTPSDIAESTGISYDQIINVQQNLSVQENGAQYNSDKT